MVYTTHLTYNTNGFSDIINITDDIDSHVNESTITSGIISLNIIGSTASLTTIEYEPALVKDMKEWLEKYIPSDMPTRHGSTWGDDNGFSHIRATLMGPSITFSIDKGQVQRGTWQQIVVIDHDNRPRERRVILTIIGE